MIHDTHEEYQKSVKRTVENRIAVDLYGSDDDSFKDRSHQMERSHWSIVPADM